MISRELFHRMLGDDDSGWDWVIRSAIYIAFVSAIMAVACFLMCCFNPAGG